MPVQPSNLRVIGWGAAEGASGVTQTIHLPVSPATSGGNSILVLLQYNSGAGTVSVSDSAGNTYHLDYSVGGLTAYRAGNALAIGAGGSITAVASGGQLYVLAIEVANLDPSASALDTSHQAGSTTGGSNTQTSVNSGATGTVSQTNDLILGLAFTYYLGGAITESFTPGAGYTLLTDVQFQLAGGTATKGLWLEYKVPAPSAGTYVADGTLAVGVYSQTCVCLAYKGVSNSPPNPPTLLPTPGFDATATKRLAWAFSDPDAGDAQTAYDLVIINHATGLQVTVPWVAKVIDSAQYRDVPGGTLSNGVTYDWKVRTWDRGDLVGSYSILGSFTTAAGPTATIINPATDGDTIGSTAVTVEWTFSSPAGLAQASWHLLLITGGATVWDSGVVAEPNTRSVTPAFTLTNSTTYTASLVVTDAFGTASSPALRTFNVSVTPPPTPVLFLNLDVFAGIIVCYGNYVAPAADPPSRLDLYRRIAGETAWTRIASAVPTALNTTINAPNYTYFFSVNDYTPAHRTTYQYKAVTVNPASGASADSAIQSGQIALDGLFLHDPADPTATFYQFLWDNIGERGGVAGVEATLLQYDGRPLPVAEIADRETGSVSCGLTLPVLPNLSTPDRDALQALFHRHSVLCYRDRRGRKAFGIIKSLSIADGEARATTTVALDAVDFSEAV